MIPLEAGSEFFPSTVDHGFFARRHARVLNRHTISSLGVFGRPDSNLLFRLRFSSESQELIMPREDAEMEPTTAKVTAAVEVIRKRIQQVRDRKELIGEHQGGAD